ncbi:hypothetical protein DAPPUDRAFT_222756 [Daphnia pulex]|uniref:RING-type domain-containing protein n=1 Tax=Daphnia pulex TaxID=6669 RepID=E9G5Z8_DAPPU|nr:hypothetical protein DAPPUDRAFT_222756 [Daphnia pulex]|eukprot:EFX84851.1 hypothetical protein DAPPUDRAFT_222756 [Daphnia pulex]
MQMLHIASQLTYLAVAANFGSIFTVLICCAAMILFIRQFRLYEFEPTGTSVVQVKQPAQQQLLNKVNLPFSLEVGKLDSSDLSGNYHLTLYSTSYFPCLFVVCREMSLDLVKNLINEPWQNFLEFFRSEMKICPNLQIYAEEEIHELKPFSIKGALDCIPRTTYALVAFHIRTDAESMNDGDPTALITLIHIPDRYCNAPATTLCQYLKCNDGRVLNLKPLYSPEKSRITPNGDDSRQRHDNQGNINCVICWNFPATHVLLPCRHACLCVNCFKRVENCPVCRTRVMSYFLV